MGGTKIVQSTPPAAPTAGQSAAEYAAALPQILQAQLEFQPQFDQAQLESFRQLGPQFAQVSRDVLEQFSPTLASLDEELAKQALQLSETGLSESARDLFRDEFKSLVGNQVNSGIGADFISSGLVRANEEARNFGRNLGLSLQGKVPISQAFQQPSNFQVASGFQPAFATNTGAFSSVFSGAGRPLGYSTGADRFAQISGGVGGLFQGIGSLIPS